MVIRIIFKLLMLVAIAGGAFYVLDREKAVETANTVRSLKIPNPFKSANPLEALKSRTDQPRVQKASVSQPNEVGATTRLYKWRNAQGNWVISDKPPESDIEFEARDYPHNLNVVPAHSLPTGTEILGAADITASTETGLETQKETAVVADAQTGQIEPAAGETLAGTETGTTKTTAESATESIAQ